MGRRLLLWLPVLWLAGCTHLCPPPPGPHRDAERLFDLGLSEVAQGAEPRSLQMLLEVFPSSAWAERAERLMDVSRELRTAQRERQEIRAALERLRRQTASWGEGEARELFDRGVVEVEQGVEPRGLEQLVEEHPGSPWHKPSVILLQLSRDRLKAEQARTETLEKLDRTRGLVQDCMEENERLQYDLDQLKQLTIEMELRR